MIDRAYVQVRVSVRARARACVRACVRVRVCVEGVHVWVLVGFAQALCPPQVVCKCVHACVRHAFMPITIDPLHTHTHARAMAR